LMSDVTVGGANTTKKVVAVRWIFEVCAACQARANRAKPSLGGRSFSRLHIGTPLSEQ
jgi:hypothetical protein